MSTNGIMMQYFEWYLAPVMLWRQMADEAAQLAEDGVTAVWIPPAYKGSAGLNDTGYGAYDIYDLGEFDQKGTVPTKYGTKDELVAGIRAMHEHGVQVYADIVLDHKMGADEEETVNVAEVNPGNRNQPEGGGKTIKAWTHFYFPGRNGVYSNFEWHWYYFTGIDWDALRDEKGVYKIDGKTWDNEVDKEHGNFDYLMGADIDLNNDEVTHELKRWGKWFVHITDVDGFRLDAVKHMKFVFYSDWLDTLRREEKEELFAVGEYWNGDFEALKHYVDTTKGALSLFDVPLHYRLHDASAGGSSFDMRTIFDRTLTKDNPLKSVTFVDNHDTQPGQSLESWVEGWFKPLAYALILLRQEGYPCIFYGDYYGIPHDNIAPMRDALVPLMKARRDYAYGVQNDYFDHPNTIGWTREGDDEHEGSGLAVVMTNGAEGEKRMFMGPRFAGAVFHDCTGNRSETIKICGDGYADFPVNGGSVSVWVKKPGEAFTKLTLIDGAFSVCQLDSADKFNVADNDFIFYAKTDQEISLVCRTGAAPKNSMAREDGWRAMRVEGKLDFSLTGVIARISSVLAAKNISVFVTSTFDTDYVLVKEENLETAQKALEEEGYEF